jgi:hypothetical protein
MAAALPYPPFHGPTMLNPIEAWQAAVVAYGPTNATQTGIIKLKMDNASLIYRKGGEICERDFRDMMKVKQPECAVGDEMVRCLFEMNEAFVTRDVVLFATRACGTTASSLWMNKYSVILSFCPSSLPSPRLVLST